MLRLIVFSIMALLCFSCDKKDDIEFFTIGETEDFIIFGAVYGECYAPCNVTFLLTSDHIYRNVLNESDPHGLHYSNEPMGDEAFDKAKALLVIPNAIYEVDQDNTVNIVADGDYYLQVKYGDRMAKIIYDEVKNVSREVEEYLELSRSIASELR